MDEGTVLRLIVGDGLLVVDHSDTHIFEFLTQALHKHILLSNEQRGERGIVVVPAPAFT